MSPSFRDMQRTSKRTYMDFYTINNSSTVSRKALPEQVQLDG